MSILQSEITKAIYTKLISVQTSGSFYDDMGGRIYVGQAPPDLVAPFAIVTLISEEHGYYFDGAADDDATALVQLDIYTTKDAGLTAHQLTSETVQALINRASLSTVSSGTVQVYITDFGAPEVEADTLRSILQLDVMAG